MTKVLLLFFLCTTPGFAQEMILDQVEASVNSSIVLTSDVHQFRRTLLLRSQLDPLFGGSVLATKGAQASHREIVDFLIEEKLILERFPVTEEDVEREIKTIQANNNLSRDILVQTLRQQGFSFEDYKKQIRGLIAKKNLIGQEIKPKVYISDDDVKNFFYNKYSSTQGASFAYRIRIITVTPSNYTSKKAAIKVIQRAQELVRSGEPFEEVARRLSDDSSASNGGDLGVLTSDEMSPLIREEIKNLKVGEVSRILGSQDSAYFLIKLSDIRSGQEERYKQIKEEIRQQLSAAEFQRQISLWLSRERQEAFVHLAGDPSVPRRFQR